MEIDEGRMSGVQSKRGRRSKGSNGVVAKNTWVTGVFAGAAWHAIQKASLILSTTLQSTQYFFEHGPAACQPGSPTVGAIESTVSPVYSADVAELDLFRLAFLVET